jgi:hypothetical protein
MIRKSLSRTKGKRSKVKRSRYTGHLERGRKMEKKHPKDPEERQRDDSKGT